MARVILTPTDRIVAIGERMFAEVSGTLENETIELGGNGRATFDPSFNRGGDTIRINGVVADYRASVSGSNVVITNASGAEITIPVGAQGLTLEFLDQAAMLRFDGAVRFGNRTIDDTPGALEQQTQGPIPIVVLAGQSNAEITAIPTRIYERLDDLGGAFEYVHFVSGGTSMFANDYLDWDPASRGELADQLIAEVRAAIDNVHAAGREATVSLFWVHGETDAARGTEEFLQQLTDFLEFFRDGIEAPNSRIILAPLSFEGDVRAAQLRAAELMTNVGTVETLGAETSDGAHFAPAVANRIADDFINLIDPVTPIVQGYDNLLPETIIAETDTEVHVTGAFYESLIFNSGDDPRRQIVEGGLATDRIETGSNDDWVSSWDGDDYISTGAGHDFINAGSGNKTAFAGEGNDTVWTGLGDDYVSAGPGNDGIRGKSGRDTLHGDDGDDIIEGGLNADILWGGTGSDIFKYVSASDSTATSTDRIADFEVALDRIDLAEIGALTFIGRAGFSGTGQIRYETGGDITMVYANISGDLEAELVIALTGNIDLSGANFILG